MGGLICDEALHTHIVQLVVNLELKFAGLVGSGFELGKRPDVSLVQLGGVHRRLADWFGEA